jgi:hypothetical protein
MNMPAARKAAARMERERLAKNLVVIAGLDPAIHASPSPTSRRDRMDARIKSGHDDKKGSVRRISRMPRRSMRATKNSRIRRDGP